MEKQNAEQGMMPVIDGVAEVESLMALYKSAEEGRVTFPADEDLSDYVPVVARV